MSNKKLSGLMQPLTEQNFRISDTCGKFSLLSLGIHSLILKLLNVILFTVLKWCVDVPYCIWNL